MSKQTEEIKKRDEIIEKLSKKQLQIKQKIGDINRFIESGLNTEMTEFEYKKFLELIALQCKLISNGISKFKENTEN